MRVGMPTKHSNNVLSIGVATVAFSLMLSATMAQATDPAVIEAAKKEGALSYATNTFAPTSEKELQAEFRKHYGLPDSFEIHGFSSASSNVISRVGQELKADKLTVDWVGVNVATFWNDLRKRGEVMEYCSESFKGLTYREKTGAIDGGCQFQALTIAIFGLMWNPAQIKDNLTTWAQVTDPKYKGKIIFGDVRKSASYLDTYVGLRKNNVFTLDWLKKIKAQEPFFLLRSTDVRDRVMSGEFPIAIFAVPRRAYQVKDKVNLKVSFPKEGLVLGGSYAGILKKAPHPNAAKLWQDFMFSKKGGDILIRIEAIISLRSDLHIPDDVKPYLPKLDEIKSVKMDWLGLTQDERKKYREEFRGIFGQ